MTQPFHLQRAVRPVRVPVPPRRSAPAHRAARFAAGIARRHVTREGVRATGRELIRAPGRRSTVGVDRRTHVTLSPRVSLTYVLAEPADARGAAGPQSAEARTAPSGLPPREIAERQVVTRVSRTLIRRLATQGRRTETHAGASPPARDGAAPARHPSLLPRPSAVTPIRRIVTRTASPPAIEPAALTLEAPRSVSEPARVAAARAAAERVPSHMPMAVPDLRRVTDDVIAAIDDRIVAQRERLGMG
jgi:hypothetical protein